MDLTTTDIFYSVSKAVDKFFDTEAIEDYNELLTQYSAVESMVNQRLALEMSLISEKFSKLPTKLVGQYPRSLSKTFGVVSAVTLLCSKLTDITQMRTSIKSTLEQYANARNNERADIEQKLNALAGVLERDKTVSSVKGAIWPEDKFIALLRDRDELLNDFKLDLSAFDKTSIEAAVAGFRNASKVPFKTSNSVALSPELSENVVTCIEELTKKLLLCSYVAKTIRDYIVSVEVT